MIELRNLKIPVTGGSAEILAAAARRLRQKGVDYYGM